MTTEQKAKAYDEAIKEAAIAYKDEDKHLKATLERIFPELKESEDEKIRKALIRYFTLSDEHAYNEACGVSYRDIVAWLKKEGAHANFRNKIQEGDHVTRNDNGELVNLSQLERVAKQSEPVVRENKGNYGGISPNSEWSGEDEENFRSVYLDVKSARQNTVNSLSGELKEQEQKRMDEVISWLKSLKNRVGCEVNHTTTKAWSEEDENLFRCAIDAVKQESKVRTDGCLDEEVGEMVTNWLKSLKDRYTWKPSDEHYELEEFAKIVRGNLTGISKAVQELFKAKYLQLTGNKMYGGYKD